MAHLAERARERGRTVRVLHTDALHTSRDQLAEALRDLDVSTVTCFDVADDWLSRDLTAAIEQAGLSLRAQDILESPGFLTSREDVWEQLSHERPRMTEFYAWHRRRLGIGRRGVPGRRRRRCHVLLADHP
ncbi:MAG: cryptochrome/photolyase family protein [Micrococcus sp.]|nr:cryptochrome/photolyase family protein [Micrococcus sp.]